jgi:hypothetical protein
LAEQCRARKPWEKSTGPRTKNGKEAVSQNAWKGGWRDELRALRQMLREQDDSRREVMIDASLFAGN